VLGQWHCHQMDSKSKASACVQLHQSLENIVKNLITNLLNVSLMIF
jgi:hypothetical protein